MDLSLYFHLEVGEVQLGCAGGKHFPRGRWCQQSDEHLQTLTAERVPESQCLTNNGSAATQRTEGGRMSVNSYVFQTGEPRMQSAETEVLYAGFLEPGSS